MTDLLCEISHKILPYQPSRTNGEQYNPSIQTELLNLGATFQNKYFLISIPVGLTSLLSWILFPDAPLSFRVYFLIIAMLTQVLAGIGFWGIILLLFNANGIINKLPFNVWHGDGFGGLGFFGKEIIRGLLCFSTGVVFVPIIFEIMTAVSNMVSGPSHHAISQADALVNLVQLIPYILLGLIALFIFLGFFSSQYMLYSYATQRIQQEKGKVTGYLGNSCNNILSHNTQDVDRLEMDRIELAYQIMYTYLDKLRPWPFNFDAMVRLAASLLIPLFMAVLEIFKVFHG